jgi:hypothetical protein
MEWSNRMIYKEKQGRHVTRRAALFYWWQVSHLPGVWVYSMSYKVLVTDTGGYDDAEETVKGLKQTGRPAFVLP